MDRIAKSSVESRWTRAFRSNSACAPTKECMRCNRREKNDCNDLTKDPVLTQSSTTTNRTKKHAYVSRRNEEISLNARLELYAHHQRKKRRKHETILNSFRNVLVLSIAVLVLDLRFRHRIGSLKQLRQPSRSQVDTRLVNRNRRSTLSSPFSRGRVRVPLH